MAIGFTPKHKEEFPLTDLSSSQYISLALAAAENLEWTVFHMSSVGFKAQTKKKGLLGTIELVTLKIIDEIVTIESSSLGNEMVDLGRNKKHVGALLDKIQELKPNFSNEELDQRFGQKELISDEEDDLQLPPATASQKIKDFASMFWPQKGYAVTPVIVNLNLIIFIAMVARGVSAWSPDSQSLLDWGANFRPMTLEQPGRLISNCFLHIGILHLLFNMYALIYVGLLLEPFLGKVRFITAYLLAGIAASLTSLWWHDLTISAGASGAIFGMYGVFLALLTTDLIHKQARTELLSSVGLFIGYNLFFGMSQGIDNAAHIGGLLSGILIGYAMVPSIMQRDSLGIKLGSLAGLVLLTLCSSFVVYKQIPNDVPEYERRMQVFTTNESQALEVLNVNFGEEKQAVLSEITNRGIYYWNENIRLVKDVDTLELPEFIHSRNKLLLEYCKLRIKSYEAMSKGYAKGKLDSTNLEFKTALKEVEDIMGKLNGN